MSENTDKSNASETPETSDSDDDTIKINPFLFRIHEKLAFCGLKYSFGVPQFFFDFLEIYLKNILRGMSEYKVHYEITFPMQVDGNIIDPNAVIESRRVYYGRGRFTVEDFKEFLDENENHEIRFPNRRLYLNLKEQTKMLIKKNEMKKR